DIFSNKIDRYEATIKLLQLKRTNFKQGIPGCEVIRDDHAKIARSQHWSLQDTLFHGTTTIN
ncbi:hypothetical protein CU097_006971, partial [Rhizopus azygosporus]